MTKKKNTKVNPHLGDKVKEIRKKTGLNQTKFGKKIGLTQQGVGKIEQGQVAQTRTIKKIAALGKVSVSELIEPIPRKAKDTTPASTKSMQLCDKIGELDRGIQKPIEEIVDELIKYKALINKPRGKVDSYSGTD